MKMNRIAVLIVAFICSFPLFNGIKELMAAELPCVIPVHQGESIQNAITQALQSGQDCTIWIDDGNYANEPFEVIWDNSQTARNITISGAAMDKTVISGTISISSLSNGPSTNLLTLQDVTIQMPEVMAGYGNGIICTAANIKLERVRITGNRHVVGLPIGGSVLNVGSSCNAEVVRSIVSHNLLGMTVNFGGSLKLINSTFFQTGGLTVSGFSTYMEDQFHSGAYIANSIFAMMHDYAIKLAGNFDTNIAVRAHITHNNFFGNVNNIVIDGAVDLIEGQNIEVDPKFRNAAIGDFRLRDTSQCKNAGDSVSPRDLDGTRADIGASPLTFFRQPRQIEGEPAP